MCRCLRSCLRVPGDPLHSESGQLLGGPLIIPIYLALNCRKMALLALSLLAISTLFASAAPLPIWSSNKTSNFVFLRSPDFTFRAEATTAVLSFTAVGSPRPPEGTTQAKLLGAASIYVNGVLASAGPGHNVPTQPQVVRSLDGELLLLLLELSCPFNLNEYPLNTLLTLTQCFPLSAMARRTVSASRRFLLALMRPVPPTSLVWRPLCLSRTQTDLTMSR